MGDDTGMPDPIPPFNPLSATSKLLRSGPGGGFSEFVGTCFGFRHPDYYLTAAHCVGDLEPAELLVSQTAPSLRPNTMSWRAAPVIDIVRHETADLAVLSVDSNIAGPIAIPFSGHTVSNFQLGEDFLAYGYPESVYGPEAREPTPRLFKGHYQRFFGHQSHMGHRYLAAELNVGCPAGLSGGPLFRPGAHSVVVAVATENIESATGADFEEEYDGEIKTVYRRVITYGVALLLDPLRAWIEETIPNQPRRTPDVDG